MNKDHMDSPLERNNYLDNCEAAPPLLKIIDRIEYKAH